MGWGGVSGTGRRPCFLLRHSGRFRGGSPTAGTDGRLQSQTLGQETWSGWKAEAGAFGRCRGRLLARHPCARCAYHETRGPGVRLEAILFPLMRSRELPVPPLSEISYRRSCANTVNRASWNDTNREHLALPMLMYLRTSLLESNAQTVVNTVNCVGVMGKGIAAAFKQRYPDMFRSYRKLCNEKKLAPGKLWLWQNEAQWVLNFPTKNHWRNGSRLEWIEAGLERFVQEHEKRGDR